ncbi:MAG: DUF402 domain-containing protein [Chloroflexota bacterium]
MPLYQPGQMVTVQHRKPWRVGKPIQMRGSVSFFDGTHLILQRRFRSPGLPYDGLYARQRPGDHGTIEFELEGWVSRRRYLRADGALIGELYNIQTPTEFLEGAVRYVDLEIDVAYLPMLPDRVQIQDVDELRAAEARGHISGPVATVARGLAEELAARLGRWDGQSPLEWSLQPSEGSITPEVREALRRWSEAERRAA